MAKDTESSSKVKESFQKQAFMSLIGAELVKIESGYCEIRIPYSKKLTQQHGFIHAGVISTIADTAAGYAGFYLMGPDSEVLTVEFKINLMAPAKGDYFIAKAKVIKKGRTLTIAQSEVFAITDKREKLCALAQVTLIELPNT